MLRHLFILARGSSSLPGRLTILLDRHLSRGDQVEIVEDQRRPSGELTATQWLAGRERRRASTIADQLQTQGYAIISREEDAPPGPAPRPLERAPAARAPFARAPVARAEPARSARNERPALWDRPPIGWGEDPEDQDDFARPRRSGGLVAVFIVVVALGAGLFFFSTHARDRLVGALTPASPPAERARPAESATPADSATPREPATPPGLAPSAAVAPPAGAATEEPARAASVTPAPLPPTSLPAASSPATRSPALPPSATASSAKQEAAPADPAAPAPSTSASLPPRRTEASAPDRSPDPAPPSPRSQRLPDFPGLPRVEVSRATAADITTFTVRLTDPRGRPLPDAQVWLRQKSTDGFVRETPLEPVSPAGSYRGAVPGGTRRADELTLRIVQGDRRMEMPVAE
jgi:hypothetical protein